jgi:DNA-binding MarR family transcriptional regulator
MTESPDVAEVAGALRVSIGLLVRRLRQIRTEGELTLPESSALSRLDRGGATTSSELARQEQISPQSMGATLGALEARGLAETGRQVLGDRRDQRTQRIAKALSAGFTEAELQQLRTAVPLLERLAQSI